MPDRTTLKRLISTLVLTVFFAAFATASSAQAKDLYVQKVPEVSTHNYTSLSEALRSAEEGDTIHLESGEVEPGLTIAKNVTIEGPATLKLAGGTPNSSPAGWNITAAGCKLEYLTFEGWPFAPISVNAENCTIEGCRFVNCTGGVILNSGPATVSDCQFEGTACSSIVTEGFNKVNVSGCEFSGRGGDVLIGGDANEIANCTFRNASICVRGNLATIKDTCIEGGQIRLANAWWVLISRCEINGSRAGSSGADLDCICSEGDIGRFAIINDTVMKGGNRGIALNNTEYLYIRSCNVSGQRDSGIALSNITGFEFFRCNVSDNSGTGASIGFSGEGNISQCKLSESGRSGIDLRSVEQLLVSGCNISGNPVGISIDENCSQVKIQRSTLDNAVNAADSSGRNQWNSSEEYAYTYEGRAFVSYAGNRWSDYGGTDSNGDGMGDSAYIRGSVKDDYPLMHWPLQIVQTQGNQSTTGTPTPTAKASPAPGLPVLLIALSIVAGAAIATRR